MAKYKWIKYICIIILCLIISGCSASKLTQDNQGTETKELNTETNEKMVSDTDLAKQLETEKGIESVMVQVVEGEQRAVNVDIVISNEQELSPDQIVDKYSKVIKEKYPDRVIDIIVAKEGKLLTQKTLK